ncbi:MAG: 1-deoxy-D-xylulose-5-phosphate reductoisomerase, partial [Planctomycetales bacterium 12-60-4]
MNRVVVLGSSGSIGTNSLDVVAAHPNRLQAIGLSVHRRWQKLAEQSARFQPRWAVVSDPDVRCEIGANAFPADVELLFGEAGVEQ